MQIHIKKLDGQKEEFSLEPNDSVMKVKEMLAEKTGVHKDQIRLIFKGKPMVDDKTLDEQQVKAGATVHMIMQMRGQFENPVKYHNIPSSLNYHFNRSIISVA